MIVCVKKELMKNLWNDMSNQNWNAIRNYFQKNAKIYWHNTNEQFDVDTFIKVNAYYPDIWKIEVKRLE
jgi:hypothetical protein